MKYALLAATSALALVAGNAHAGNLDRTKTPIDIIFAEGNYAELSYSHVSPSMSGVDKTGQAISNVGDDFSMVVASVKFQLTDRFALALIHDQPYGVDVEYGPNSPLLGGTTSEADTNALTMLLRYDIANNIAVYGGPRVVRADGAVSLSGLAYGPLSGYDATFGSDQAVGYIVGAAYEIPDIAFRAALTYHSEVDLELPTVETFPGGPSNPTGVTNSTLPQSVKLQVQSGIAPDTLAFGSVRWSEHSVFTLNPPSPATPNLTELDDSWTYEVGLGRRFTDRLSARVSYIHEDEDNNDLVSPLAPTKGRQALAVGAEYQLTEAVSLSGGVRYIWLGDAQPETGTPDTARASFSGNDAVALGMKIGVSF